VASRAPAIASILPLYGPGRVIGDRIITRSEGAVALSEVHPIVPPSPGQLHGEIVEFRYLDLTLVDAN